MCSIYSYNQLNAEFQRITRRDKKAFFNEQCKEIEKKKIEWKKLDISSRKFSIKGIFHASRQGKGQKWKGSNRSRTDWKR